MRKTVLLISAAAILSLCLPASAQFAPPAPTPEQLARTAAEDQLSDAKCGVPRNAGDDYRPKPALPDQTRAPRLVSQQKFKVETVASGLNHPWALAFLPSGNMLVTIRAGGLRIITKEGKVSEPLTGTPPIKNAIKLFGMHDVILDRDFAANRTLYLAYVTTPEGKTAPVGYVASAKLAADESGVTEFKILKEGAMTPRRILQAKDGALLVVTADILPGYAFAQSLQSPQGKVLRINPDGSIPKDNPYLGTTGADPSLYAVGFRDSQGMALHPHTGDLWITENEPRGGDELNLVRRGKNYGFPLISYGRDNDGTMLNGGKTQDPAMEQPIYFWTPSVALSGMTFYTGSKFPEWKDDIFAGGLSGMQLVRLKLSQNGRVVGEEKLLRDRCRRIRDVRQGPDGLIYLLTEEDNGEILRLSPDR